MTYPSSGLSYSQVCGRTTVHYSGTPDGLEEFSSQRPSSSSLDDNYVDGVSLTHSTCPRSHIWTFSTKNNNAVYRCINRCAPTWTLSIQTNSCMECSNSVFGDFYVREETFHRNLTQPTIEGIEMKSAEINRLTMKTIT